MTQKPKKAMAYGGVVFDAEGRILLREVAGHYGGYVYTFAKGRPDPGETPEETALREVREETGIEAEIVGEIPGVFEGDTTDTKFYAMRAVRDHGDFHAETAKVMWVDAHAAVGLIALSTTARGRERDTRILKAAVAMRLSEDGVTRPVNSAGEGDHRVGEGRFGSMKYDPTGAHSLHELVYWGLRQRAERGAQETAWKLKGYARLREAREALLKGDASWAKMMLAALSSDPLSAKGGLGSLVAWQMVGRFKKWVEEQPAQAEQLLRQVWEPSAVWPQSLEAPLSAFEEFNKGAGYRISLAAVLAAAVDPDQRPPYKARGFARAYKFSGYPPERAGDALKGYVHAVGFLQAVRDVAHSFGESLTLLEAHDAVWYAVGYDAPDAWSEGDKALFATFRGDAPPHSSMYDSAVVEMAAIEQELDNADGPEDAGDARNRVLRSIVERHGQSKFRKAVLSAYGSRCAVTACDCDQVLEAAHIRPVADDGSDAVSNGILLRADIHTLFDLGLLTIDAASWSVIVAPGLRDGAYGEFHGRALSLPASTEKRPSVDAVSAHRKACNF